MDHIALSVMSTPELQAAFDSAQSQAKAMQGRCRVIQGKAERDQRELTPAESASLNALFAQFDDHSAEAAQLHAALQKAIAFDHEQELRRGAPRQTSPDPLPGSPTSRSGKITGRTYAGLFPGLTPQARRSEFASFAEFALATAQGGTDPRLIRNAGMLGGSGQDGGFLVPTVFLGQILDSALQQEIVRPRANLIPLSSNQGVAGVFDFADGTSGKRGGLQLLWGPEATALTEQKGKIRELGLAAKKGSILCRVSNELASDAPAFDAQLSAAMVAAVAAGLDNAFVSGTGAGQPLGILNAPCLITVNKLSGQAANTIMFQNLSDMVGRLAPSSFGNSVWMVHPTAVPKLFTMAYTTTNIAGTENVSGVAAAAVTQDAAGNLRIFGRPVFITDSCSALSAAGDVILADLSRYVVGLRADATMIRDNSVYFGSDEIAFRLTLRLDGQPQDAAAMKLRDGTNTVSPFVTLQAR